MADDEVKNHPRKSMECLLAKSDPHKGKNGQPTERKKRI